jgi:hypothetical protein
MAKKLPYFKFETSEWTDGNVTVCSLAAQGLFINICALYWSRKGDLDYETVQSKFKFRKSLFEELVTKGVVVLSCDRIVIEFLEEQFEDRKIVSFRNTKNASERWKSTKLEEVASESHTTENEVASYLEENRTEENREEQNRTEDFVCDLKDLDPTIVKKSADLTEALCKYFAVKTIVLSPAYNKVCDYVTTISHRNELDIAAMALQKYMAYKARSDEKIHNITSWIGTKPNHYQDGQWYITDWEAKNKNYNGTGTSIKGIIGQSGPEAGKDYRNSGF